MRSQKRAEPRETRLAPSPPVPGPGLWERLPVSRGHAVLFCLVAAFYVAVIIAVLTTSRLVALDWKVMLWAPYQRLPKFNDFLNLYVVTGQRGPSAIAATAWLAWRSWRTRSWRPLLILAVALVLLNMTVGAVKIFTGRMGPHYAHVFGSNELFMGGGIFPSGHTANAVVTWGVLAYLAIRGRRAGAVLAGWMGFSVGVTTVYLGTHWVSDVLAGWASGLLVLLALPLFEPIVSSMDDRLQALLTRRRGTPSSAAPIPAPRQRELQWSPQ